MSEDMPQNTPTIRGNIGVGFFVLFFLIFIFIFVIFSADNIVMFIPIVVFLLSAAARFYYLMYKEINKIRKGYYDII